MPCGTAGPRQHGASAFPDTGQLLIEYPVSQQWFRILAERLDGVAVVYHVAALLADADLNCPDNGRASVAPSLLATALLLQAHDKVSDAEAKAQADFDIWWKVALGIEIEERPFAKSTLQLFRAQLILHDMVREVFERRVWLARERGYLKRGRGMRVSLDTTHILSRGTVKDTYNLLADGIVKLIRVLAMVEDIPLRRWAESHG